jgi:hypothetical protein
MDEECSKSKKKSLDGTLCMICDHECKMHSMVSSTSPGSLQPYTPMWSKFELSHFFFLPNPEPNVNTNAVLDPEPDPVPDTDPDPGPDPIRTLTLF